MCSIHHHHYLHREHERLMGEALPITYRVWIDLQSIRSAAKMLLSDKVSLR